MDAQTVQYRGYDISVTVKTGHDDLWDYTYQLKKVDDNSGNPLPPRSGTAGGHLAPEGAYVSGTEAGKTEVDNLIALEEA
jgi:hypothetical protein